MARPTSGRAFGLGLPLAGLVLLLFAAGAHFWIWRSTVAAIEQGMARWAAEREAAGWVVSYDTPLPGGWPFAASVRFPALLIASGPGTPFDVTWSAGRAEARIVPPEFGEVVVDLPDPQILVVGGVDLRFAAERLVLRLPVEGGAPPLGGRLEAAHLRLAAPELLPEQVLEAALFTAAVQTRPDATEAEAALTLTLRAVGVTLPRPGLLGQRVEEAAAALSASGPVPGRRSLRDRLEVWRDAGGSVALSGVRLRYGPVTAEGEATLALDATLQPMGAGRLVLTGLDPALAALAEAGAISHAAAGRVAAGLRLLARAPEPGAPPRVEVPLLLENRTLSTLRIPLARLPRLPWPAEPAPPR
jgi:hypothetical protein